MIFEAAATRRLGRTPLAVTLLGFGGAPLGNLYRALGEEEAAATLQEAIERGIRYFDTAPLYGFGLSEHRTGAGLRRCHRHRHRQPHPDRPGHRHSDRIGDDPNHGAGRGSDNGGGMVLSTKVGRLLVPDESCAAEDGQFPGSLPFRGVFDYSYDGVMRSFEDSLQRLGLARVDILLIHDVDVWTHGSEAAADKCFRAVMDGGYRALDQLRSEGTIGAVGAGVNEWEACERFARAGDFDCFLLAGRYTLLEQTALDSFLPLCEEQGISVIIGGPYNTGILATGAVEGAYYNYEPAPPAILDKVRRMEDICRAHDVSLASAALQFPLHHPSVASVIPGARSAEEVRRNVELLEAAVPESLWTDFRQAGLLRPDAPVA